MYYGRGNPADTFLKISADAFPEIYFNKSIKPTF